MDSTNQGTSILIRQVPTNVDFSRLNQQVGKYVCVALTSAAGDEKVEELTETRKTMEFIAVPRKDKKGRETIDLVQKIVGSDSKGVKPTNTLTSLVAKIRLIPQSSNNCKGYGFIHLVENGKKSVDLTASKWTETLNGFTNQVPLRTTTRGGKAQQHTLLFRCGAAGTDAEKQLRAAGRAKKAPLIESAGAKLLALVVAHGGSMHIKYWPQEDRKILNELGKRRKITPTDAAKAAGLVWDGQSQYFSLPSTSVSGQK